MARDKLNNRQLLFVDYYMEDWNATQAYAKAYGTSHECSKVGGCRLANSELVKKEIEKRNQELKEKHEKMIDRVVEELARIALSDPMKAVQIVEKEYIDEVTGEKRIYQGLDYTLSKNMGKEVKSCIRGIKPGKNGIEIEQYDKMKAIELLFQYLGVNKKIDANVDGEVKLDFSALSGLSKEEILKIAQAEDNDWEKDE